MVLVVIKRCLDETAFNYDANACFDDSSCIAILEGCTDLTHLTTTMMQTQMMNLVAISRLY